MADETIPESQDQPAAGSKPDAGAKPIQPTPLATGRDPAVDAAPPAPPVADPPAEKAPPARTTPRRSPYAGPGARRRMAEDEEEGIAPGHSPRSSILGEEKPRRWVSWPLTLLIINTLVMVAVLVLALRPRPRQLVLEPPQHPAAQTPAPTLPEATLVHAPDATVEPGAPAAVSWRTEEKAYLGQKYEEALAQCQPLIVACERRPADELLADFFRVRAAQCMANLGAEAESLKMLATAMGSRSPLVRGFAMLRTASQQTSEGQYLTARSLAYQALASAGAADGTAPLVAECDFLAAETLTRKALSFYNSAEELPPPRIKPLDPFLEVPSVEALRAMLESGISRFEEAASGPKVKCIRNEKAERLWTVACAGAPLEELLSRVAGDSGLNVRWENVAPESRRRPVVLGLVDATDVRVIEVACGAAGLVARLTGTEVLIHDPRTLASATDLRDLLAKEAVSTWRRLLLRDTDANRLTYAHFALGMIFERQGDKANAMTEYRLLTQRHPRSALAPQAELRGAAIRMELRDYAGAREDLLALLNRHPNFPASDLVCLRLGEATLEAGLVDEAITTFKKLYHYELSRTSQVGACLGAGKAYYRKGEYKAAAEWLERYFQTVGQASDEESLRAGLLLAKSLAAEDRLPEATAALRRVLDNHPTEALRTDALLELARLLGRQGDFTAAIAVIKGLCQEKVPQAKVDDALILEAKLLREVGLPERGLRLLRSERASSASAESATRMTIEMARCYADSGDPEGARRILADLLSQLPPGPLAHEAACDLAEICLKTDQPAQAIGACRELLKWQVPETIRARALNTLGAAYVRRRDYARAAIAFSGKVPDPEGVVTP